MPTREEMRSLGNEIVRSYEGRISGIAQIKTDTSAMLKGFDRDHAAMSKQLKADLAKVPPALQKAEAEREQMESQRIAQRKADTSAMLQEFAKGDAERKSDVSAMLKGFDRDHAAMSKQLKADLAKVPPALQKAEAEREQMESQRIAQRKSDVSAMLKGFDKEQAGVRDEWHKLNATMHARRAGKAPEAAPPPPEEMGEE